MNEARKLFSAEAKLKETARVWWMREQVYVRRMDFGAIKTWEEMKEGLKPQISSRLAEIILHSLSDSIQVATQIKQDILARSSHKVAAQNNQQGDKFNTENSYNGAAENSQSYPT
ncbi:hypothetical protein M9H77_21963 [Catharanthus roseus]|uniref:Uncharacterized protein n=1 Tax=Catharanthus roseus TaxID=4058 RepID=A0ACC0AQK7_CATRO|nr:hypothetical protein M9H77_21963 [Catharanthus roseus]